MSNGNISSLLGGFGGCGLIPQTVLNVKSGGKGHFFSSISYTLAMALFVLDFAPFIGQISSGIVICVAFDIVAWELSLWTVASALNPEYHRDESKATISRAQHLVDFLALSISTVVCTQGTGCWQNGRCNCSTWSPFRKSTTWFCYLCIDTIYRVM
jgi:hypothetical protein